MLGKKKAEFISYIKRTISNNFPIRIFTDFIGLFHYKDTEIESTFNVGLGKNETKTIVTNNWNNALDANISRVVQILGMSIVYRARESQINNAVSVASNAALQYGYAAYEIFKNVFDQLALDPYGIVVISLITVGSLISIFAAYKLGLFTIASSRFPTQWFKPSKLRLAETAFNADKQIVSRSKNGKRNSFTQSPTKNDQLMPGISMQQRRSLLYPGKPDLGYTYTRLFNANHEKTKEDNEKHVNYEKTKKEKEDNNWPKYEN
jgi:hypothetical protein